jgi:hypothetical protein
MSDGIIEKEKIESLIQICDHQFMISDIRIAKQDL